MTQDNLYLQYRYNVAGFRLSGCHSLDVDVSHEITCDTTDKEGCLLHPGKHSANTTVAPLRLGMGVCVSSLVHCL